MTVPAWCRVVLSYIVPEDRWDDVLGDLEEVHRRRRARSGWAWLQTSAETLLLMGAFLLYRLREREWTLAWFAGSEVRLGLRLLLKQPILAATSILALAMGIGVATTGFSVVDNVFHGELPFAGGERFVRLEVRTASEGWSIPLDLEWYGAFQKSGSFEHFGALDRVELNLLHRSGEVDAVLGAWITPSSFRFLPYVPLAGRTFSAADGAPGAPPTVMLRESLWQRRYGGRYDVIGEQVNVGGQEFTVIGVLRDDAGFPTGGELWLPLDDRYLGGTAEEAREGLTYFGVLRDGVAMSAAREEVAAVSNGPVPAGTQPARLRLAPYIEASQEEGLTATMMLTVLVVLLVVISSNVAHLLLARASSRTGELAVRTALGAGRSRLVGQLAVEAAFLATIAAALGLFGSHIALRWMEPILAEKPFWLELSITPRTVAFVVGLALLVSFVCGVLPGLRATRGNTALLLGRHGHQGGNFALGRVGALVMVVEMGLSVAMLSGALVMARGLAHHAHQEFNLPQGKVLTASISHRPRSIGEDETARHHSTHLSTRIAAAMNTVPGVVATGAASALPRRDTAPRRIEVAPEVGESPGEPRMAPVVQVKPGFLEALDARVLAGRMLQDTDFRPGARPVAVVNEPFVRKFLGGRNPIGRRIRVVASGANESPPSWLDIVGVVPDLGLSAADPGRAAGFYVPWPGEARYFDLALRTEGDPLQLAGPLRQVVADLDPTIRVSRVQPLEQVQGDARALRIGFSRSLVALGVMVLLLALLGVYAMISFSIARRTREIGIRVALGATRRQIVHTVAGVAGLYLALGGALGIVLAGVFMGVQDKLFGMRLPSNEPWVVSAVVALFAVAGLVACWVPARQALGIQPMEALRFE